MGCIELSLFIGFKYASINKIAVASDYEAQYYLGISTLFAYMSYINMSSSLSYDVIIIGAGIVGLACAERLSSSGAKVLVIERHPGFGNETSSRNSEVIHAGIYYPQNSLKAILCVDGNRKIYVWCEKYRIPHYRIGKFIVAVNKDESERLENIYQNGIANGVQGLKRSPIENFRKEEPHINAHSVLWSGSTGIVDSHKLMASLEYLAIECGCDFAYNHSVEQIKPISSGYEVVSTDTHGNKSSATAGIIINSAGLDSDSVAEMAGINADKTGYRLHYCKGHYFKITPSKSHIANHLIYPVPNDKLHSLGIHITCELDGSLKLGPDSQYLATRQQDYSISGEAHRKFYQAAAEYINGLEYDDITPGLAGIRPKLQTEGGGFRDFVIAEESGKGLPGLINLIGIESPGLTCCLTIADYVFGLLR